MRSTPIGELCLSHQKATSVRQNNSLQTPNLGIARILFQPGKIRKTLAIARVLLAGVPGLEPRTKEPETFVLPITPYPTGSELSPEPTP